MRAAPLLYAGMQGMQGPAPPESGMLMTAENDTRRELANFSTFSRRRRYGLMCVKAVTLVSASGRCSGSKRVVVVVNEIEHEKESLFLASLPDLASVSFT